MNSDKSNATYLKIVVKNVENNTLKIVSRTVYTVFPAMRFTGSGQKPGGTTFNYQGEKFELNLNSEEAFALQNEVCVGSFSKLVEALRKSVPVVSCRLIYPTEAGIRVKIEATL